MSSTYKVRTEMLNTEIVPAEKTVILSKNASKAPTVNPSTYNVTRHSQFEGKATLLEKPEMMKTTDYQQAMVNNPPGSLDQTLNLGDTHLHH